jgi:predicted nucleic acid-binding protein
MIIFIDTSAWVKFFIKENGTEEIQYFMLNKSDSEKHSYAASAVTYAEMMATFMRSFKGNRITQDQYNQIIIQFDEQWENFNISEVNIHLVKRSGMLAQRYALKGCDAFQLASALNVQTDLFIASDHDLLKAAKNEGLIVWNPISEEYSEIKAER